MKKLSFILALCILFKIGYASEHFRERIERVSKKQETGLNFFNFEQELNTSENWRNISTQTNRQTTAENINEFDMLLQGRGIGILNCVDIGATGTLSESLLYTTNYFYRANNFIDSVEYTFYNSNLVELFKLMIRADHLQAREVRIVDFSYQLFTTNTTRREFVVQIYHFAPSFSPENRRTDYMIIDDLGTHLHTFTDADAIMLYRNGNVRRVVTVDRPEVLDQVLTNDDTTSFRVWSVTAGANAPTAISLQTTHRIGSKNLVNFNAPLFDMKQIGSNYYYYIPHYEQPYLIGTPAQGVATPDNTGIVELFNISNSESFKQFELPMPNWTQAMRISIGMNFWEYDFTTNVFSDNGKLAVLYGLEHYLTHCDCYQATYHVVDEDGEMLKNMETRTINVKRLANVSGQNSLYSLETGEGDGIGKFIMFDPIEWELGTEFEAIHNGEKLTLNYERIPYGDDYAIIFAMDAVLTEGNTKYAQINYYDKNGEKIRNIKLDIGPLGLAFSPMFSPAALNPYLINADSKLEFIGVAPRRVQAGSDAVTLRLFIYNEDGDLLYFAEDEAEILSGAGIWTFDRGQTYSYFSLKYRTTNWIYTDRFLKLPFATFTEGDGTIENPYLISDAGQLNAVRNEPWAHYKVVNDIDMKPFIDANGWTPLPAFTGTLDGQNFTIKNLKLTNISTQDLNLFGTIRNVAKIENLRIEDAEIIANASNTRISFLAGMVEGTSLIKNVHVTGSITSTANLAANVTIGTIAADMIGSGTGTRVEDCSFDGVIEVPGNFTVGSYVGGIVGSMRTTSTVNNCVSRGKISFNTGANNNGVGGIVGMMRSICFVTNCYSNMNITGTNYTGGIVGRFNEQSTTKGTIENCYATGRIIATGTTTNTFAGGIIGWTSQNSENVLMTMGGPPDWEITFELDKKKLNMGGLIALNDSVTAPMARRISAPITGSNSYFADLGIYTADSIRDCYALVTIKTGAAGLEDIVILNLADANSVYDGANITTEELTEEFLIDIGWSFGNDTQNPWVWIDGGYPKLWFEVAVYSVTLDDDEITLHIDDTHLLTATILPEQALNKNVTWTSNDETIATVIDGLVTAVAAGRTTITVTTEDGGFTATCIVNVLPNYTVSASALPAEGGSVTGAGTYASGAEATLVATPNDEYEFVNWTKGGEEVSTDSIYSFIVTENVTLVANFREKSGVVDIKTVEFSIYPNPVSDVLKVVHSSTGKVRVEIYSSNGAMIRSLEMNEMETQINVATLSSGIYFIRFVSNEAISTQRFVKE